MTIIEDSFLQLTEPNTTQTNYLCNIRKVYTGFCNNNKFVKDRNSKTTLSIYLQTFIYFLHFRNETLVSKLFNATFCSSPD